jgi:hypothetical protein
LDTLALQGYALCAYVFAVGLVQDSADWLTTLPAL